MEGIAVLEWLKKILSYAKLEVNRASTRQSDKRSDNSLLRGVRNMAVVNDIYLLLYGEGVMEHIGLGLEIFIP